MAKIIYKMTFHNFETGDVCEEVVNVARSEEDYETICKDWSKYTGNVTIERLITLYDNEATVIANKIIQWNKEDAEEEHYNPTYEVSPLII